VYFKSAVVLKPIVLLFLLSFVSSLYGKYKEDTSCCYYHFVLELLKSVPGNAETGRRRFFTIFVKNKKWCSKARAIKKTLLLLCSRGKKLSTLMWVPNKPFCLLPFLFIFLYDELLQILLFTDYHWYNVLEPSMNHTVIR
jgi:hypothetical protein